MATCRLRWLRKGSWIVAMVVLAVTAVELVVCSGTHAGNELGPAGIFEGQVAAWERQDGPAIPGWDWEWNWNLDPGTTEGPVLLR